MATTNSTARLPLLNSPPTTVSRSHSLSRINTHSLLTSVQGQLTQATARSNLTGPIAGADHTYRDQFDLTATVQSPCGKDTVLNINSDVRTNNANNTKGSGYITTDSVDAALLQTFSFQWLKC